MACPTTDSPRTDIGTVFSTSNLVNIMRFENGGCAHLYRKVLFRKTIQKNRELEARVVELERELTVWKVAFTSNDEEKATLKKQVIRLERNIGSLKVRRLFR